MEEEKPYYIEIVETRHIGEVIFAKSRQEAEDRVIEHATNPSFWENEQFEPDLDIVEPEYTYIDLEDKDGIVSKADFQEHYFMNDFCNGNTYSRLEEYYSNR